MRHEQIDARREQFHNLNRKEAKAWRMIPKLKAKSSIKIIWAIDPTEDDMTSLQKMAKAIKLWSPNEKKIFPLSILSPLDLGWPMEITDKLRNEILSRAQRRSAQQFIRLPFHLSSAEILISPKLSLLTSVRKMLQFAAKQKADLIMLYSRRSEKTRLTGFGSFSELTVASSNIPVMVIGKHTKVPTKISKILYPTDFSPHRRKSFQLAMDWAKRFDAELILYHQVGSPLTPMTMTPLDAVWMEAAWEAQQENDKLRGSMWVHEAQRKGIRCRLVIGMGPSSWVQRTLETAKRQNVDLVIISHRRGLWGQTLFGGEIRKLFAESACPLVLAHSS